VGVARRLEAKDHRAWIYEVDAEIELIKSRLAAQNAAGRSIGAKGSRDTQRLRQV